jgi:hypothetical protein
MTRVMPLTWIGLTASHRAHEVFTNAETEQDECPRLGPPVRSAGEAILFSSCHVVAQRLRPGACPFAAQGKPGRVPPSLCALVPTPAGTFRFVRPTCARAA